MKTTTDFLLHYRRQRSWTRSLVAGIPEEHFDWRPSDSSFSCGEVVRHLMQAEIFWVRLLTAAARGESFDPFGLNGGAEQRMSAFREQNLQSSRSEKYGTSFGEALGRWEEIQQRTEAELAKIPDEALDAVELEHPLTRLKGRLWQLMLVMLEHEGHHRGQLSAYLKVLDVDQPAAVVGV